MHLCALSRADDCIDYALPGKLHLSDSRVDSCRAIAHLCEEGFLHGSLFINFALVRVSTMVVAGPADGTQPIIIDTGINNVLLSQMGGGGHATEG